MTRIEKDQKDLEELSKRVKKALEAMNRFDKFGAEIAESEIKFRYDSIVGILLIAQNDIFGMIQEWSKVK